MVTDGGVGSNLSGIQVYNSPGQPLSPAAVPVWVNWLGVCPDSGSLQQQPSLGDTPLLAIRSLGGFIISDSINFISSY